MRVLHSGRGAGCTYTPLGRGSARLANPSSGGQLGAPGLPKELFSPLRPPTVVTDEHIVVTVTISGGAEPL
jgi:hypothetical protein